MCMKLVSVEGALIIHKKYVPYRFPHVSLIFFVSLQAEKKHGAGTASCMLSIVAATQ